MTGLFERIDRPRRLPDEIARSISEAIETGALKPGDRLPTEQSLSAQFGVARTVVREAVSLLKYDGVIESRRGVGAFISQLDNRSAFRISPGSFEKRQQLVQLLQLRTGVQAGASGLAATAHTRSALKEIETFLYSMASAVREGRSEADTYHDAEVGFYRAITEASGNPYYIEFISMIERKVEERLRAVAIKNVLAAEWGPGVLAEHEGVYRAVKLRDADAARHATRTHFERAAKRLAERADITDV
ncbi:MAG: FCD domain-containing protein [Pseudomonadota bacterium]